MTKSSDQARHLAETTRVHVFDAVRGFSVISMIAFHFCYDLKFIAGLPLDWFAPPLQDIWRSSISWCFVFVAGCMFAWSRNNLKRAGKYLAGALAIFVVTTLAAVDVPINFGVIYCMGACTLAAWILSQLGFEPRGMRWALVFVALFLVCLGLPRGHWGFAQMGLAAPRAFYQSPYLAWLGFPGPGFASGDYYPLLPYLFLYLAGSSMGRLWREKGLPSWCYQEVCPPLEWVGQKSLVLYFAHQPVLLALTMAVQYLVQP